MKYTSIFAVVLVLLVSACETPNNIPASGSGVITTDQYLDPKSVWAVSPEDTPGVLGDAGKRGGEVLKDANEDIGKASENTVKFFKKL